MNKKIIIYLLAFVVGFSALGFSSVSLAGGTAEDDWRQTFGAGFVDGKGENLDGGERLALGDRDPRTMAAGIINIALTLLGIIAVVIVLLGGFKWMTAAGNEDQVADAKKILGAGVVGLIIVLSAWGIATFLLDQLWTVTQPE